MTPSDASKKTGGGLGDCRRTPQHFSRREIRLDVGSTIRYNARIEFRRIIRCV